MASVNLINTYPQDSVWSEKKMDSTRILVCTVIALSAILGGVAGGTIAFTIFQISWPMFLIAAAGSVTFGLGMAGAVKIIQHFEKKDLLNKYTATPFRTVENIDHSPLLAKNNKPIIEEFLAGCEEKPWYKSYKAYKNLSNEGLVEYFWKGFQKGLCAGFFFALRDVVLKQPHLESLELIKSLSLKKVFEYQIKLTIAADLCEASKINKKYKTAESELYDELTGGITKCKSRCAGLDISKEEFNRGIKKTIAKNQSICFSVEIQEADKGHMFFAQIGPSKFRFFDSLSEHTGFYDFPDLDTMIGYLHDHIFSYKDITELEMHFYNS